MAKEKPDGLTYGSSGPGSMHHLSTSLMLGLTDTSMVHARYKGTPPALVDLLGGRIQVLFGDATTLLPQIKQGKVRALAVSTAKRSPAAPDVPTMAEAGVPGFETASWQMILAPAGTPPVVIARLNREIREIPERSQARGGIGAERGMAPMVSLPPTQLNAFVKREIKRWGEITERAGVAGSM